MRLRPHRRTLVVWSSRRGLRGPRGHAGLDSRGLPWFTQAARPRRIRRCIRTGALLTIVGLMRVARAVRADWRLPAGVVLTVAGVMLRSSPVGVVMIPGLLFLVVAILDPASPQPARTRRAELERELGAYATPAERRDLEATLDLYPDGVTYELRDILARQLAGRR
jgi:hypothetical protein